MIAFIITIIKLLLILGVVATIHEFGHFLAAKLLKVDVEEFSIGFGPKLFQKKFKETTYSLRCLPLGGYVSIEGEEGESDSERSFSKKKAWEKVVILSMGVIFNAILAIIIFLGIAFSHSTYTTKITALTEDSVLTEAGIQPGDTIVSIDGKKTKLQSDIINSRKEVPKDVKVEYLRNGQLHTVMVNNAVKETGYIGVSFHIAEDQSVVTNEVEMIASGGAAANAKMKAGDKIVSINGVSTPTASDVVSNIEGNAGKELTIVLDRKGETLTKNVVPEAKSNFDLGIQGTQEEKTTLSLAFASASSNVQSIIGSYVDLFRGRVGVKDMSGIVGIGEVVSKTSGLIEFLNLMGIISLAVGVANIMPFPPLDGGKIVIVLGEAITRKKMSVKAEAIISYIGFGLLICLTLIVTYNDILRIF